MKPLLLTALLLLPAGLAPAAISTLQVHSIVREIIGTTAEIPVGGSTANTSTWQVGDSARFIMRGQNGEGNSIEVGMEVAPTAGTGYAAPGTDSLMIARTVNSQGLKDAGTFSIFVYPTQSVAAGSIAWTMDISVRFFTSSGGSSTFTTPQNIVLLLNNLDIDFGQLVSFKNDDYSSFTVAQDTKLTHDAAIPGYTTFKSALTDSSTIADSRYAVVGVSDGGSEFNLRLAHNSQALFMFESRNPPVNAPITNPVTILPVPEPGTAALALLSMAALAPRRRARALA